MLIHSTSVYLYTYFVFYFNYIIKKKCRTLNAAYYYYDIILCVLSYEWLAGFLFVSNNIILQVFHEHNSNLKKKTKKHQRQIIVPYIGNFVEVAIISGEIPLDWIFGLHRILEQSFFNLYWASVGFSNYCALRWHCRSFTGVFIWM